MPDFQPLNLSGRAILVTGASSGIGRAAAIWLSKLGARVALSGRNAERLQETVLHMEAGEHIILAGDLTTQGCEQLVARAAAEIGSLAALVHCAGMHQLRPLKLLSRDQFTTMLDVNLLAAMQLTQAFRKPAMRTTSASVVFVSSVMGSVGQPCAAAYSASKAALEGLSRSLALELAPERIRVNTVAPAVVLTEMTDRMLSGLSDSQREAIARAHPLGFGTPDDVAGAIAFLIADTGRWITGSTLVVDGGYTAQ